MTRLFALALSLVFLMATSLVVVEPGGTVVTARIDNGKVHLSDTEGTTLTLSDKFGTYDPETNTRTLMGHSGGYLYKALVLVKQANERGEKMRLLCKSGCISSSTLFLNATNMCIGRDAWFGFHGPTKTVLGLTPNHALTAVVADNYPKELRYIFLNKWSKRYGMGFFRVSAKELKQLMPRLEYCNGPKN